MRKKQYIIKMQTDKLDNFDPNLEKALKDIKEKKFSYEENFDFEIKLIFDEYVIDESINSILNTFLHDIMNEDSFFNSIYNSATFVDYIKEFIINVVKGGKMCLEDGCEMQAFVWTKYWGKFQQFYFDFELPKTIITKEKYENFMGLGPDYIMGNLTPSQMFQYLVAPLYVELARADVLSVDEFKDIGKYQMGLK